MLAWRKEKRAASGVWQEKAASTSGPSEDANNHGEHFAPAEHQQVFIRVVYSHSFDLSLAASAWSNRAIHVRNGAVPAANGAVASQIASAAVCARIIAQSRRHHQCHHLYHLHHLRRQIRPADRLSHHCQPTGWALRLHLAWIKQRGLMASALADCASRRHYLAVTLAR